MKKYMTDLLSIEEHKTSVLVLILIGVAGVGLWKSMRFGDYPEQLLVLTEFLVGVIAGVNIASKFSKNDENKNEKG